MRIASVSNCSPQACKNNLPGAIYNLMPGYVEMYRRYEEGRVCLIPRDASRADQHTDTHRGHTRQ